MSSARTRSISAELTANSSDGFPNSFWKEAALAESLEAVFAGGVEQFSGLDFPNREGKTWTPDGFESESKWFDR